MKLGFRPEEWRTLADALRAHAGQNEVLREEEIRIVEWEPK